MKLSVAIITFNEEANLERTLASVRLLVGNGEGEIVVVDSGSTDRTVEIAQKHGARVFVEEWKGYAAQKNSALDKCSGDWILSLDADEEVSFELAHSIQAAVSSANSSAYRVRRRNLFLGRWMRHGGFYPDTKIRLFTRSAGRFPDRLVHEDLQLNAGTAVQDLRDGGDLIHYAYPTLSDYIDHMNRYSSLGAEMAVEQGKTQSNFLVWKWNIVVRPAATFFYNYVLRLGFLDGREGLLLHMYHAVYVSWKYAKAWEKARGSWKK